MSTKSTKTTKAKRTPDTIEDELDSMDMPAPQADAATITVEQLEQAAGKATAEVLGSKKVRFYELVLEPKTTAKRGQAKLVTEAIAACLAAGVLQLDTPVSATELGSLVADRLHAEGAYKVRAGGGDILGSVLFHLHHLGRQFSKDGGFLRAFDCTRAADGAGWVEVDVPDAPVAGSEPAE